MRRSGYILRATNATAPTDLSPGWRLQSMLTPLALIGPPHLAESRTQGAPKQETRGSQACDKGYARTQPRPRDQQSVPFLLLLTIDLSGRPVATSMTLDAIWSPTASVISLSPYMSRVKLLRQALRLAAKSATRRRPRSCACRSARTARARLAGCIDRQDNPRLAAVARTGKQNYSLARAGETLVWGRLVEAEKPIPYQDTFADHVTERELQSLYRIPITLGRIIQRALRISETVTTHPRSTFGRRMASCNFTRAHLWVGSRIKSYSMRSPTCRSGSGQSPCGWDWITAPVQAVHAARFDHGSRTDVLSGRSHWVTHCCCRTST